ncbi:amidohydrolase family protein [Paenarthrobacter sp. AR 02]|uniref:amidohydrolase family protein n=1 Tax=Paenarthrobacter sp. AR 02 TaxID=2899821 RepID=UPI001F26D44A|nr:amidohydrolase family protein [Paenarthrobacter sp. AR 02]MCF3140855.1 amidohydrolase family protein [Paenarthrobacter sp. AR 02]
MGIVRDPGSASLLRQAVRSGADLIGGIDPCGLDRDPRRHLDVVFGIAEAEGVGVDIHLHELGELGMFSLDLICERVRVLNMQGKVTISHAHALATASSRAVESAIEDIAALDIAVTTIAPGGNRVLPLKLLTEAGVRLGLGQDGMRDYWSPFGDADMLSRTWQLAFVQQLRKDSDIEDCLAIATLGGRAVLDPDRTHRLFPDGLASTTGLDIGDRADMVLLPGESPTSVVMDKPTRRTVIRAGKVIAKDGVLL